MLVVTLQYRTFGKAIASHFKASTVYDKPVQWLRLVGGDAKTQVEVHDMILQKYRLARNTFLGSKEEIFVSVEDDMVLPDDALIRLENALKNADVAYGLYCWRLSLSGGAWSAFVEMSEDNGMSVLVDLKKSKKLFEEQQLVEVCGVGLGCTAIRRHVLEKVNFETRGRYSNDWYFALDCTEYGFKQVCDFGLQCGHIAEEPTPRILWPSIDDESFQRIEYL